MKKRSSRKWKRIRRMTLLTVIRLLICSGPAFSLSYVLSKAVIPLAAAERGYSGAIGGEYLLLALVFFATFFALWSLTDIFKD